MAEVNKDKIGLASHCQAANVLAHKGGSAANRRSMENLLGRHGKHVFRGDAAQHRGPAHLLDHIVRGRVCADPDLDAAANELAEIFE
jgi:hypothetical protein